MDILALFKISASALDAQTQRMAVLASNMANAKSMIDDKGTPFQAKRVFFQAQPVDAMGIGQTVAVTKIVDDTAKPTMRYDPGNPYADGNGYVKLPNINPIAEMVDMIDASRQYQANLEVMSTTKDLALQTIDMVR